MLYQPGSSARSLLVLALSLFALLALQAASVKAQDTVTGAFEGTVTNSQTGAPIAGATVQFINQLSEVPIAKRSDASGRFYQGLLPPGTYTIRVSAPGFKTREVEQRLLATRPNQIVPVPVVLDPEGTAAATTPTPTPSPGASPQPTPRVAAATGATEDRSIVADINTTDARRGGAFTREEVSTLPLGATTLTRSFDELALLLPGVADPPQTLGVAAGPGIGPGVGSAGQFSVNGLRSRANNFTVDGSDNNDEDIGVRRQGFFALVPQPIESIEEFQIITLLAPAQFGRNIGAQVNAISKSGGNKVHGIFYGFFNPNETNSRNFFDTNGSAPVPVTAGGKPVFLNGQRLTVRNDAGGKDPFRLFQGGFALGGPVMRDKWFFFFSGEGQDLHSKKEVNFAVPTLEQRGVFRTGTTGLSVNPFTGAPVFTFPTTVAGDAVFSFFPFANNPGGVYGPNTFTQQLPSDGRGTILSAKSDLNFKVNEKQQSFTIRYNFTDDRRIIPVTGGALFSSLEPRVRTQNISTFLNSELSDPSSTTPLFNQLRLSYGRTRLVFDEVRDQEFLLPTRRSFTNPDDAQFLLNTRFIINNTLPGSPSVNLFTSDLALTGGTGETETTFLGPPPFGPLGPIGQINVAGFSPIGTDVFNFPQRRVNNTYQLADNLSWRRGKHSFVFGADIRRTELNSDLPRNSRPLLTFNGAPRIVCANPGCTDLDFATNVPGALNPFIRPEDFVAAGAPSGVFQSLVLPGRDAKIALRYYQLNFFAQDEWRIRRNFSLSFGLRYEYNTVPHSASDNIERTFNDPALSNTLVAGLQQFIDGRSSIFEADKNNFAPRIGFAYSPNLFGHDKTSVIRAGYGLFYDQILGAVVSQSRNVFPTFTNINFGGGPLPLALGFNVFNPLNTFYNVPGTGFVPIIQPGTLNTINPDLPFNTLLSTTFSFFPSNGTGRPFGATLPRRTLETPLAHHFSVTFEQQLSQSMVVSAAYVGTRGRNLLRFSSPNLGPNYLIVPLAFDPFGSPLGGGTFLGITLDPGSLTSGATLTSGRPVNTIGPISLFESTASSDYDALQLQARGRFMRKLQYQIAYTFSKATDDVSDVFDLAGAPALPQNSLTFEGERAPANFDARHRFSYNFLWDLPDFSDHDPFFRQVFGNLQIAGTGRYQTGQPFTVNSIFDVNLDGNLTDRLNSTNGIQFTGDRRQPIRLAPGTDTFSLLAPFGTDGRVPRNTFRAGSILELDLAVIKSFEITEQTRLQFRVDFFNFINRANFGIPVRFLEAPGFGQATDTVTPGRRIQFALKFSF